MSPLTLASLLFFLHFSFCLKCKHCFKSSGYSQCFDDCDGDYCTLQVDGTVQIQGCVTGVPDLQIGCRSTRSGWVCLCDGEKCNSARDLKPILPKPQTVKCRFSTQRIRFQFDGGKQLAECTGFNCFHRTESYLEAPGQIAHVDSNSCRPPPLRPGFYEILGFMGEAYLVDACYYVKDDASNYLLDCSCKSKNFCNDGMAKSPASQDNLVECYMVAQGFDESDHSEGTCLGQFCFIQQATINTGQGNIVTYRKGCFSVEGDKTFVSIGYRKFDHGTTTEESWFCARNYCNRNLAMAKLAVRFGEMFPPITSTSGGTNTTTAFSESTPREFESTSIAPVFETSSEVPQTRSQTFTTTSSSTSTSTTPSTTSTSTIPTTSTSATSTSTSSSSTSTASTSTSSRSTSTVIPETSTEKTETNKSFYPTTPPATQSTTKKTFWGIWTKGATMLYSADIVCVTVFSIFMIMI